MRKSIFYDKAKRVTRLSRMYPHGSKEYALFTKAKGSQLFFIGLPWLLV